MPGMGGAVHGSVAREKKSDKNEPEAVLVLDRNLPRDANLSFVDFVPSLNYYDTYSNIAIYHQFCDLVIAANTWLESNPNWQMVNCETVTLYFTHTTPYHTSKWISKTDLPLGFHVYQLVSALRLWIVYQPPIVKQPIDVKKLQYIDLLPKRLDENGVRATFESIGDMIARFNRTIKRGEFTSRIISLQSIAAKAHKNWDFDTEATIVSSSSQKFIYHLRIFYLEDVETNLRELHFVDFVPELFKNGTFLKKPTFEPFRSVLGRASKWVQHNPQYKLLNGETIDVKMKSFTSIETTSVAHNVPTGDYIRILRCFFLKKIERPHPDSITKADDDVASVSGSSRASQRCESYGSFDYRDRISPVSSNHSDSPAVNMQSKVFIINKADPTAHNYNTIKEKIAHWFAEGNWFHPEAAYRWKLINVETFDVLAPSKYQLEKSIDEVFMTIGTVSLNSKLFLGVRVYYDIGSYEQLIDHKHNEHNKADTHSLITPMSAVHVS